MKIRLLTNITAGKTGDTITVTPAGGRKLVELGAAEPITEPAKRRTRKSSSEQVDSGDTTATE